jgi:hypothetical protein
MSIGHLFPRSKAWLGHDADHSPPSNAKVKKEEALYLLTPQVPSMVYNRTTLLYFFNLNFSIQPVAS